eukprot:CAMPEP_0119084504 /NCGR_PEP_ID=MMETSP1178-20130426/129881_1 /TAXON_ID=33656 /ORGANISM="unid sp, Strain CCMP2000" /LENGTH=34 /DNA_ID= /DNA_START= /DNA_END= /DNA_ORIENTATION=
MRAAAVEIIAARAHRVRVAVDGAGAASGRRLLVA